MNFLKKLLFGSPQDQFAKALMAEFLLAEDKQNLQYDKATFCLTNSNDEKMNLGDLYQQHCQLPPEQRPAHLKELVHVFMLANTEVPSSFEEARPNLRPKVWFRRTMANMRLQLRLNGKNEIKGEYGLNTPTYPLGEHLLTTVVYEQPPALRSLSPADFEKWGVTYYEAMEAACENLNRASIGYSQIRNSLHAFRTADCYDTSRILLKEQISSLDVLGEHVAMVPNRNALFVTGSEDDDGLKMMLKLAEEIQKESELKGQHWPTPPILLRLVDGEWEDWMLPSTHELFTRFGQLRDGFFGNLYAGQKELLDAIHEKEGGPFVAAYSGAQKKPTDPILSFCVWSQDVDSLLPKTQVIVLAGPEGTAAIGEWDRVTDIVGDLLVADDSYYPVLYRANEFPTQEQLNAIGMLEV